MATANLSDDLQQVIGQLPTDPRRIVFLSGAGISGDAPSNGPLGPQLTINALEQAFDPGTLALVKRVFDRTGMPGGLPRLETVLGVVVESLGSNQLRHVLRPLIHVQPNDLHKLFAEHAVMGGSHVTANVDAAIEAAIGSRDAVGEVFHFHGRIDDGLQKLGLTLSNVENGFPESTVAVLDALITGQESEAIVVVGYSGSDYFDMNPYLAKLAKSDALAGKLVVWIDHDASVQPNPVQPDAGSLVSTGATLLSNAGATVVVVRGPTRVIVNEIALRLGLEAVPVNPPPRVNSNPELLTLTDKDRAYATFALFDRLGMPAQLVELNGKHREFAGNDVSGRLAGAEWDLGHYRSAADIWSRGWDDSVDGDLRRRERMAACQWMFGCYLRARRELRTALRDAEHHTDTVPLVTRLLLTDSLIRVLEQMRRLPDLRFLASRDDWALVRSSLPSKEAIRSEHLGQDLEARAEVARAKATGTASRAVKARSLHEQSSSVSRTLQFEQGRIRDAAEMRVAVSIRDCRVLFKNWMVIGALGNAARMFTIPGASRAFKFGTILRTIWSAEIDYAKYHRVRLTVIAAALSTRDRFRRYER